MKRFRLHIFLLTLVFGLLTLVPDAQAQSQIVTGYLGKRFIASYNLSFINAIVRENYNGNKDFLSFSARHQLGVEYILTRQISAGFDVGLFRNSFNYRTYDDPISQDFYNRNIITGRALIHGLEMASYFRFIFSNTGAMQPLGSYAKLGVHLLQMSVRDSAEVLKFDGDNLSSFTDFGFSMEIGSQRIVMDRIILRFGVQSCLVLGGRNFETTFNKEDVEYSGLLMVPDEFEDMISDEGNDYTYSQAAAQRIYTQFILNFNIGVGVLIF